MLGNLKYSYENREKYHTVSLGNHCIKIEQQCRKRASFGNLGIASNAPLVSRSPIPCNLGIIAPKYQGMRGALRDQNRNVRRGMLGNLGIPILSTLGV